MTNPYAGVGAARWDWPRWDDLRFPAQGINPLGSVAPASIDTATGCLSFAGNADNVIMGVAQMPHGWKVGSIVKPHVHLRFPTADAGKNTAWQFAYDVANVDGDFANAVGTLSIKPTVLVANPNNTAKHVYAALGDIAMTGLIQSAMMMWSVTRLAATSASDDDTNACLLLEFDIHYQIDRLGTTTET